MYSQDCFKTARCVQPRHPRYFVSWLETEKLRAGKLATTCEDSVMSSYLCSALTQELLTMDPSLYTSLFPQRSKKRKRTNLDGFSPAMKEERR